MTKAQDKILFNQNKRLIKASLPDHSICPYCNSIMVKNAKCPYALVSIDHIVPYTKGGGDELTNLVTCCANCNTRKGNLKNGIFFNSAIRAFSSQRHTEGFFEYRLYASGFNPGKLGRAAYVSGLLPLPDAFKIEGIGNQAAVAQAFSMRSPAFCGISEIGPHGLLC